MSPRPAGHWKLRVGGCAAAFALTGIVVYCVGRRETTPDQPNPVGTIEVRVVFGAEREGVRPLPNADALRQQLLDDASLRSVMSNEGDRSALDAKALARLREGIRLAIEPSGPSGRVEVSIRYTGADLWRGTQLVNGLGQCFAQQKRAAAEAAAREATVQAGKVADAAYRQWVQAKTQRDAFLEGHFERLQREAEALAAEPDQSETTDTTQSGRKAETARFVPPPSVSAHLALPTHRTIDNPERVDLDNRLQLLQQRRLELLAERTALHPEVLEIEAQVDELRRRLASVPRQILAHQPPADQTLIPPLPPTEEELDEPPIAPPESVAQRPPGVVPPRGANAAESRLAAGRHLEDLRQFSELDLRVKQAAEAYQQRVVDERRFRYARPSESPEEIYLAAEPEIPDVASRQTSLPLLALVAALAAAVAVGVMPLGSRADLPLVDVAEVQASLPVPVIGAIPSPAGAYGARFNSGV